jgi:hypothetical protein
MASIKDYSLKLTLTVPASYILKDSSSKVTEYFKEAMEQGDTKEMCLLLVESISMDCLMDALCLEGGSDCDSSLIYNDTSVKSIKTPFY